MGFGLIPIFKYQLDISLKILIYIKVCFFRVIALHLVLGLEDKLERDRDENNSDCKANAYDPCSQVMRRV